ncbi:MarR family winged helix-turn-helix transcriptional regulator [Oceanispirochaeta sp. M1]|uniref:MarR family winged helix-turn-helix transcriptional regulator n=2 Tax=Oceanispirochaeta TaxID=2035349 RepID=UPI001314A829|nr:MarR family transcriptional regulator [Oceanispirochaeta sp. M1]
MTKDDLFNRTANLISKIHDLEASLKGQGGDAEVTSLQFDLLQILYYSGPKNLSALSHCMNINLPNSSREVKKLTSLGFIQKESSPDDKRKTELSLTKKGTRKVEGFMEDMKKRFFDMNKDWCPERIKRCIESIDILEKELFN